MEEKNTTLELQSYIENNVPHVKNFAQVKQVANNIVENNQIAEINDDYDKKAAKDVRARLNKCKDAVKRLKIDGVKDIVSEFENECKELETIFDEAQKKIGVLVNDYEAKAKAGENNVKPKQIVATLKFTDKKLIEKVKAFAEKNGCELEVKE